MRFHMLIGVFFLGILALVQATVKPTDLLQDPLPEEWQSLAGYNNALTRSNFEERLKTVFDPTGSLIPFLKITDQEVQVFAQPNAATQSNPLVSISFAPRSGSLLLTEQVSPPAQVFPDFTPSPTPDTNSLLSRIFSAFVDPPALPISIPQSTNQRTKSPTLPLAGLRIAIDPADIGGAWGSMEDRSILYPGFGLIQEGDLNLIVSQILSKRLRELGAEVFVTRENAEPSTTLTLKEVQQVVPQVLAYHRSILSKTFRSRTENVRESSPIYQRIVAEVLLTKNLEARARAENTRKAMKPDITIILQFDATGAKHRNNFPKINRNILFISGAYTAKEITSDPRQRLRLLTKLLQNVTPTEIRIAHAISKQLNQVTSFPPVLYGNSWSTRSIAGDNYVVARNLLLSREHDGPVVVTEPYFMNQEETLLRLLVGDYEGTQLIAGKSRISIYREYANAVANGLVGAFGK